MVVELSAGQDATFVSLSTNISLNLFPALLSSLTLYLVKKHTDTCTSLISEPVKPEWRVHAAAAQRQQPQLTTSVHFRKQIEFPHTRLKGNDATLYAVFKPFIFVGFFLFKPLQSKTKK